jgi:NADPH:quinone reductase-like Zn-dependent oxidoreductase
MKAVVIHGYGGPNELTWEDFADPVAGSGEVLVKTAAASINPVDYKMRSGAAKERFPVEFPGVLGRDVSGTVAAMGEGVTQFAEGDRVFALALHTYAELVVVKQSELARIPDDLDIVDAAALPLVLLTGEQLIMRGVKPEKGSTVLVAGALGGVGRTAVYIAKQAGATVIAGVKKSQIEKARSLGADEVLALDDKEAMGKVGLLDGVADAVGGKTAEELLGKVKQGGVFASVLGPPANATMHPTVRIVPVVAERDVPTLERLAEDVARKRFAIPVDRMIPMSEAAAGQRAAEKGGIGKVLLLAT